MPLIGPGASQVMMGLQKLRGTGIWIGIARGLSHGFAP